MRNLTRLYKQDFSIRKNVELFLKTKVYFRFISNESAMLFINTADIHIYIDDEVRDIYSVHYIRNRIDTCALSCKECRCHDNHKNLCRVSENSNGYVYSKAVFISSCEMAFDYGKVLAAYLKKEGERIESST